LLIHKQARLYLDPDTKRIRGLRLLRKALYTHFELLQRKTRISGEFQLEVLESEQELVEQLVLARRPQTLFAEQLHPLLNHNSQP
jgi:hypothetical protein